MAPVDIFFIVLILVAGIRGYIRGFITEVLSVAGPLLALLAGIFFSKPLSHLITPLGGGGGAIGNQIISFLIIFIVVYLVIFLVQKLLHGLVEKMHLVGADRALGVILGLIEGLTVSFVITIILLVIPLDVTRQWMAGSLFRSLVTPFLPEFLTPAAKSTARAIFHV
jgi:membrane protein required for colicin V production